MFGLNTYLETTSFVFWVLAIDLFVNNFATKLSIIK